MDDTRIPPTGGSSGAPPAETKQLKGGMEWHRWKDGWRTENGNFRIIPTQKGAKQPWLLISFIHEVDSIGTPFNRRFDTLEEAMEHAELI